jgi:hypothetical protein
VEESVGEEGKLRNGTEILWETWQPEKETQAEKLCFSKVVCGEVK